MVPAAPPGFHPIYSYPAQRGTILVNPINPNQPSTDPGGAYVVVLPGRGTGPTPATSSSWYNVRTTRRDWRVIAEESAQGIWHSPPVPDVGIGINPNPDIVAIPTWFWLSGYGNEILTPSLHLDLPWTLSYDVDVTSSVSGPCENDPALMCSHSETHTEHHTDAHMDTVDVTVTFTPATYVWDFGDQRKGSHPTYSAPVGIGRPYIDPYTPSPVSWSYEWDSRDFIGGFPISATLTWWVSAQMRGASDIGDGFDQTSAMPDRSVTWATQLVVCQVQALRTAPNSKIDPKPCRDTRVGT
jgi:hypothetical protein